MKRPSSTIMDSYKAEPLTAKDRRTIQDNILKAAYEIKKQRKSKSKKSRAYYLTTMLVMRDMYSRSMIKHKVVKRLAAEYKMKPDTIRKTLREAERLFPAIYKK